MLTVKKIAAALGGAAQEDDPVLEVTTDSRLAREGCLFAAIEGERVDGHSFIPALDEKFHHIVFLGSKPIERPLRHPYFRVEDVREALGVLARVHLSEQKARIVAVTGSVGKTTTKNFILAALAPAMQASGTVGNRNNELGVPLTGLAVRDSDQAAVVEMGMRGLGQIRYLTRFVRPDIAVVTNIGTAHLELLKSRENIARAKLELVDALGPDGKALLNGDEPLLYGARPEKECYYFGFSAHNDYRAEKRGAGRFTLFYPGGSLELSLRLEGDHQIMNALAAFGAGHLLGVEPEKLKQGIESFGGDGRRMFTETVGGVTIIDDTYNASPDSMAAALRVLAGKSGRRVAVLGDMLELGTYERRGHEEIGALCGALQIDCVIAAGERAEALYQALPDTVERYYAPTRAAAEPLLIRAVCPGDTVLFKASNSMGFDRLIAALKERLGEKNE